MRGIIAIAITLVLSASGAMAAEVRVAVTTSFRDSGLSDVLLPAIAADTGLDVQLLVVGTGQALRIAAAGDVDAVLVHSRAAEKAFVAAGHGRHRRAIMFNDFVLIGPPDDPAGIGNATGVVDALARIAGAGATFVSRGDDSGTHKAELGLWEVAGTIPRGDWYREVGAGMGAAQNTASGLDAYLLSDRASWLNFRNPGTLALLFAGDPLLANHYTYIPVDPARHGHVDAAAAARLEDWLTSDAARVLIDGYRIGGEQVFIFDAVARPSVRSGSATP